MSKTKTTNEQRYIVVERTVKIVDRVPFDEDHYPEMTTVQAIDYELQLPRSDKLDTFIEQLSLLDPGAVELTERVTLEH